MERSKRYPDQCVQPSLMDHSVKPAMQVGCGVILFFVLLILGIHFLTKRHL